MMPVVLLVASLAFAAAVQAQITVGVTVSATGQGASLGLQERNAVDLMPREIAGQEVRYIVLDDRSDATQAVINTRRLVADERVDVVLGSTTTPNSLAMIDVVAEAGTPMISWAASRSIVEPLDERRHWVFKTPRSDRQMAMAIVSHMVANEIRSAGFVGFAGAYGEAWWDQFSTLARVRGIDIVGRQLYKPTDISVTDQIQQIIGQRPDAVLIAGVGTPAVLPQRALRELGFSGRIYQTHGVADHDFLHACAPDCEGALLPASPLLVASQLPDDHPVKAGALTYIAAYEAAYGEGSASIFGAHAWDSGVLLAAAVPVALETALPGTPEFRAALRDALEGVRDVAGAQGIYNMSPTDHHGLDQRATVVVEIKNGKWAWVGEPKR